MLRLLKPGEDADESVSERERTARVLEAQARLIEELHRENVFLRLQTERLAAPPAPPVAEDGRRHPQPLLYAEPRTCPRCGQSFRPLKAIQQFCSTACRVQAPQEGVVVPSLYRYRPRACPHCGREFEPNGGRQRFCSPVCATLAQHAKRRAIQEVL